MPNQAKPIQRWIRSILVVLALTLTLSLGLTACSGGGELPDASTNKPIAPEDLLNIEWQIEDIDGGGIIDRSMVTMQIVEEGRVSGSTGCNQYFGNLTLDASAFRVEGAGSTRKACVPAIMHQEQRFLSALQDVRRYAVDGEFIRLYDESDTERLRMIRKSE